jgi:hypothetical protein
MTITAGSCDYLPLLLASARRSRAEAAAEEKWRDGKP